MEEPFKMVTVVRYKCPHCGWEYDATRTKSHALVPTHDYPPPCRSVCPGSNQPPRALADNRPLWKDEA